VRHWIIFHIKIYCTTCCVWSDMAPLVDRLLCIITSLHLFHLIQYKLLFKGTGVGRMDGRWWLQTEGVVQMYAKLQSSRYNFWRFYTNRLTFPEETGCLLIKRTYCTGRIFRRHGFGCTYRREIFRMKIEGKVGSRNHLENTTQPNRVPFAKSVQNWWFIIKWMNVFYF
jgi:hypothetical protein